MVPHLGGLLYVKTDGTSQSSSSSVCRNIGSTLIARIADQPRRNRSSQHLRCSSCSHRLPRQRSPRCRPHRVHVQQSISWTSASPSPASPTRREEPMPPLLVSFFIIQSLRHKADANTASRGSVHLFFLPNGRPPRPRRAVVAFSGAARTLARRNISKKICLFCPKLSNLIFI